jgi:hypothetical protein
VTPATIYEGGADDRKDDGLATGIEEAELPQHLLGVLVGPQVRTSEPAEWHSDSIEDRDRGTDRLSLGLKIHLGVVVMKEAVHSQLDAIIVQPMQ